MRILSLTKNRNSKMKVWEDINTIFDPSFYEDRNYDVVKAGENLLDHYMRIGWAEGRDPSPLFDTSWYLEVNEDVRAGGINPLLHFVQSGAAEARAPHPLFDIEHYLSAYPDVQGAGANALIHYLTSGAEEGRVPNALFDGKWYAHKLNLSKKSNPLLHFVLHGAEKGISAHPLFDAEFYRNQNTDIALSNTDPFVHFLKQGWREGRSPHPLFDMRWYLSENSDIAEANINPVYHYYTTGWTEGRRPNPWFDPAWYVETYTDVSASGSEPLTHYLEIGSKEGRRAGPDFDTAWYVSEYSEVAKDSRLPLQHFIETGLRKGYSGTADAMRGNAAQKGPGQDIPIGDTSARLVRDPRRAGGIIPPPTDSTGRRRHPARRRGDGQLLKSYAINRDHFWYDDHNLHEFLKQGNNVDPLPADVKRILVIGHDFELKTGVSQPLCHYMNAMIAHGGVEFTSCQLAKNANVSVMDHHADVHDFVIINSLEPFFKHDGGIEFLNRIGSAKSAVYLHETSWIFNKLKEADPERFTRFAAALPDLNILCVSSKQEQWLKAEYGVRRSVVVRNTTTIPSPAKTKPSKLDLSAPLRIVMAGTVQARKGVELFSRTADLAIEKGLPWTFCWAGADIGDGSYKSNNVEWVGPLDKAGVFEFISGSDVFFLSSADDPFPLCVLEALLACKPVTVFSGTGSAEIFENDAELPGVIYHEYTAETALSAIREAALLQPDMAAFNKINNDLSLTNFVSRINTAISQLYSPTPHAPVKHSIQKIAAVVRVKNWAHWRRMRGFIANLCHYDVDLYVDSGNIASDPEAACTLCAAIENSFTGVRVFNASVQNEQRNPFARVLDNIRTGIANYDLCVVMDFEDRIECSNSLASLNGVSIDSPTTVDRLVSIFSSHCQVGAVLDFKADNLNVCWLRVDDAILEALDGEGIWKEISVFHNSVRLHCEKVDLSVLPFDADLPKPVKLLQDIHKGEDIYVIAAGASGNFIDPSFFENKTVIGINRAFIRFPCNYIVSKEYGGIESEREMLRSGATPITSKWDSGDVGVNKAMRNELLFKKPEYYFYDHVTNSHASVDLSVIRPESERITVSYSTITTAMHLAAYMGAQNIILVGHDCGLIDGRATFDGYYKTLKASAWKTYEEYSSWLGKIESQTIEVREALKANYSTNTLSLNPFINLGAEGHNYEHSSEAATRPLSREIDRPVLLLCNGPSAKKIRAPGNVDDYLIVRMNFFLLEDEPFAGGRVDYLFWAVNEPALHEAMRDAIRQGRYSVSNFSSAVPFEKMKYSKSPVLKDPFFDPRQLHDHWKIICSRPNLARVMLDRPLPTSGVQAIAALAASGHRRFAIAGMDLYNDADIRYHYKFPDDIKNRLDSTHYSPGWEKKAHSQASDLRFFSAVLEEFSGLEFELLAPMPLLQEFLTSKGAKIVEDASEYR